MPEHDTHDLDAAFARLEHDISTLSTPPGAGAAVARARQRRRRTTVATVAAAVIAVAGVAVAQGIGQHDSAIEPTSSLPAPAPLDAETLSAATDGWTSSWTAKTAEDTSLGGGPALRCLARSSVASDVGPDRGSGNLFFEAGDASAVATLFDFEAPPAVVDGVWTSLTSTLSQCRTATLDGQLAWDGAEGRSYDLVSDAGNVQHLWLAREGSAIGLMWANGAPAEVPSGVDDGVMRSMVAALQFPGSFHDGASTSGSASSSNSSATFLSETDFAKALGDWKTAWSETSGNVRDAGSAPCGVSLSDGAASGEGASLGANGEQGTFSYDSAAAAHAALQADAGSLLACTTATYEVGTVPVQGGQVFVAAASGPDSAVVWLAQRGAQVAYVLVPAGPTPPPASVTSRIGDLLLSTLTQSSSSSAAATP